MDCCWNVFDKVIHAADRSLKITVAQYTSYSGSKAIGDISQFCEGNIFASFNFLQFINGKSTSLAQLLKIEVECITQRFRVSERVGDATHQFTGREGKKCKQL